MVCVHFINSHIITTQNYWGLNTPLSEFHALAVKRPCWLHKDEHWGLSKVRQEYCSIWFLFELPRRICIPKWTRLQLSQGSQTIHTENSVYLDTFILFSMPRFSFFPLFLLTNPTQPLRTHSEVTWKPSLTPPVREGLPSLQSRGVTALPCACQLSAGPDSNQDLLWTEPTFNTWQFTFLPPKSYEIPEREYKIACFMSECMNDWCVNDETQSWLSLSQSLSNWGRQITKVS